MLLRHPRNPKQITTKYRACRSTCHPLPKTLCRMASEDRYLFAIGTALRPFNYISLESWKKASSARHPSGPAEPSPPRSRDAPSTSEEPSRQELASRFGALDVEDLDESLNVAASVSPSTLSGEPRKRLSAWDRRCTRNSALTTLHRWRSSMLSRSARAKIPRQNLHQ